MHSLQSEINEQWLVLAEYEEALFSPMLSLV